MEHTRALDDPATLASAAGMIRIGLERKAQREANDMRAGLRIPEHPQAGAVGVTASSGAGLSALADRPA